eukprot:7046355-Alexandrium_andersonii.AAC.1
MAPCPAAPGACPSSQACEGPHRRHPGSAEPKQPCCGPAARAAAPKSQRHAAGTSKLGCSTGQGTGQVAQGSAAR